MSSAGAPVPNEEIVASLRRGRVDEVRRLVEAGADIRFRDSHGYDALLNALFGRDIRTDGELLPLLSYLIEQHVALSSVTKWSESALRVLSRLGRFDAVALLLTAGSDRTQLEWTPLHEAVALGTVEDVRHAIVNDAALEAVDFWSRTPWLLAIFVGDLQKVAILVEAGCDTSARGRGGRPPLHYAIEGGHPAALRWLLERGEEVNQTDDFGSTPLEIAVEGDDAACVEILLDAGADIERGSHCPPLSEATSRAVALRLLSAGANPAALTFDVQRVILGLGARDPSFLAPVSLEEFERDRKQTVGTANPTRIESRYREAMIRAGVNAYLGRKHFVSEGPNFGNPDWCAERFGQSLTPLPDGRAIQIGGEHEDSYDPDFCIYADVFAHHPDGRIEIYEYPASTFQPTDFHTATLIEDEEGLAIYVIGCLGYRDQRRAGETPVVRLDLRTYGMTAVQTSGSAPGWISRHRAERIGNEVIRVTGGDVCVESGTGFSSPVGAYLLNVRTRGWSRAI